MADQTSTSARAVEPSPVEGLAVKYHAALQVLNRAEASRMTALRKWADLRQELDGGAGYPGLDNEYQRAVNVLREAETAYDKAVSSVRQILQKINQGHWAWTCRNLTGYENRS